VGLDFIETSAMSGVHVDIAFRRAIISVARLLPDIKDSIKSARLPDGWLKYSTKDSEGAAQYQVSSVCQSLLNLKEVLHSNFNILDNIMLYS
jgi:hypothetical protein